MGYHFYRMVCGVRQVLVKMKREIKLNGLQGKKLNNISIFSLNISYMYTVHFDHIQYPPHTSLQLLLGPLNISPFKSLFKKKRRKRKKVFLIKVETVMNLCITMSGKLV